MTKRRPTRQRDEKEKPTKPETAMTSRNARSDEESVGAKRPVILQIRGRPALRREIKRSVDELGVTAQTFALMALREYGVGVTDEDLLDLRKGENRAHRSGIRTVDGPAEAADQIRMTMTVSRRKNVRRMTAIAAKATSGYQMRFDHVALECRLARR
jgi:hypothetical protein